MKVYCHIFSNEDKVAIVVQIAIVRFTVAGSKSILAQVYLLYCQSM